MRMTMGWVIMVVAMAACGGGGADPCDGTGTWETTNTWSSDECGMTDSETRSYTVTADPAGGYVISAGDPSVTITGTITDDGGSCRFLATASQSGTIDGLPFTASTEVNLTADVDGVITGGGTVSNTFMPPGEPVVTCSQTFTSTGTKL